MAKKIKKVCKKTGKRLLKMWSAILTFFLGISGFNCTPLYGVVEYGMPYAEFTIHGKVQSSSTGQSIPGILVSASGSIEMLDDSAHYTDTNGDYSVTFTTFGAVDTDVTLGFEDVDGTDNGSYVDEYVSVEIDEQDFIDDTPGDDWDDGEGSKTVDVDLDPAE